MSKFFESVESQKEGRFNTITKSFNTNYVQKLSERSASTSDLIMKNDTGQKDSRIINDNVATINAAILAASIASNTIIVSVVDRGGSTQLPNPGVSQSFLREVVPSDQIVEFYADPNDSNQTFLHLAPTKNGSEPIVLTISSDYATVKSTISAGSADGNGIYDGSGTLTSGTTIATIPTGGKMRFTGDFGTVFEMDGDTGKVTVPGLLDPIGLQLAVQAANPGSATTIWANTSNDKPYWGTEEMAFMSDLIADDQTLSDVLGLGNTTGANDIDITEGQKITFNTAAGGPFTGDVINATLTGNHTWTLPDQTGTIALLSDLDGNGIYDGSGSLSGDTTVTHGGNTLAFNGAVVIGGTSLVAGSEFTMAGISHFQDGSYWGESSTQRGLISYSPGGPAFHVCGVGTNKLQLKTLGSANIEFHTNNAIVGTFDTSGNFILNTGDVSLTKSGNLGTITSTLTGAQTWTMPDATGTVALLSDFQTGETYTPTNVSTDRAFDADTVAIAELADVVGTLIADLQGVGILS